MDDMDVCYLCLRVPPEEVLKLAHLIWPKDSSKAREIGLKAAEFIRKAYKKDPVFFCGKKRSRILSGLFYLLGIEYDMHVTEDKVGSVLGCASLTVRLSYRDWLNLMPGSFREMERILRQCQSS